MELELKKNVMQCYQQMIETTISQEETQEAIVPDACPDILRIVSVCGQVCLSEKQVVDGQILVTGQVDTMVLYVPEEGEALQKMTVRIPFKCQTGGEPLVAGDEIFAVPTLKHGEARILNPRKILVCVDLMLEISGFQGNSLVLCCGVESASSQGIEERMESTEIHPLCGVQTKQFTFDETLTLQGQNELEEVLSLRLSPVCHESKLIGNKLIFKGDTEVQVMYMDTEGMLVHSRHQLPFSQIMEMEDLGEEARSTVSVVVESFYMNPAYGGGRDLELTLDLMAQARVRGEKRLDLLQDAYSISHHLDVEKTQHTLVTVAEEFVAPQPLRQIFETAFPVQSVEDSWAAVGKVTQNREEGQLVFSCDVAITLLCCDESGAYNSLQFTQPITYKVECGQDIISCCRCCCGGEVFATAVTGGVEVRLTPQFEYSFVESRPVTVVSAGSLGEVRERGTSSVVLRLPQAEESLWDIAKSYGTTTLQIIQANQLQEEGLPEGKMLLIPSMR